MGERELMSLLEQYGAFEGEVAGLSTNGVNIVGSKDSIKRIGEWNHAAACNPKLHERIRELTRQVEQLQADAKRLDFLDTLRRDVVDYNYNGDAQLLAHAWSVQAMHSEIRPALDELMAALTAPPSSAPTNHGRADTGREGR